MAPRAAAHQDIRDSARPSLGGQGSQAIRGPLGEPDVEREIPPFHPAEVAQALEERLEQRPRPWSRGGAVDEARRRVYTFAAGCACAGLAAPITASASAAARAHLRGGRDAASPR